MQQAMLEHWYLGVLIIVLVIAAVTDVRAGKVYDVLTYPAIAIGLIGHTLFQGMTMDGGLPDSLVGLAVGALPMLAVSLLGGLHGGDWKLMGAVGALAGWRLTISAIFFTLVAAILLSLIVLLARRMMWQTFKRLALFVWQLVSLHHPLDPATAQSPKIPFALAICLGGFMAIVDFVLHRQGAGWTFNVL